MKRLWQSMPLTLRKAIGAVLLCIFLAILLVIGVFAPFLHQSINYGFGPQWDCVNPGKLSGLNSIKRSP